VHLGWQKSHVPGHAGPGPCHACPWSAAAPGYSSAKQPAVIAKHLQTTGAAVQDWVIIRVTIDPGQPSTIFGFSTPKGVVFALLSVTVEAENFQKARQTSSLWTPKQARDTQTSS